MGLGEGAFNGTPDFTLHITREKKAKRFVFSFFPHSIFSALTLTLSLRPLKLNDMAIMSSGLFSTFLTGETASFAVPSQSRFAHTPANLRMVRSVTFATVSEPPTGKMARGIMRPKKISPEMQALVGVPEISRTQALKEIWAYIKENNLQVKHLPFLFSHLFLKAGTLFIFKYSQKGNK